MRFYSVALTGLILAGMALAQPAFEVASVKSVPPISMDEMRSGSRHMNMHRDKARFDATAEPFLALMTTAFQVRRAQVSGPDWITHEYYDVAAKLPEGADEKQIPEMLQALLAERFHLKARHEQKEFAVYALMVGKGGIKLEPQPADYDPKADNSNTAMTMDGLASLTEAMMFDLPVVNETGLDGQYLAPKQGLLRALTSNVLARMAQRAEAAHGGTGEAVDPVDSTTLAVLQKFGLKLEPRKKMLDTVVVEHAEKTPVEN